MTAMKKTTFRKPAGTETKWVVVDADRQVVGRLASQIAMRLMGDRKSVV
jgi:ribosomal protein L13